MDKESLETLIQTGQSLTVSFARRVSSAYINERGVIEELVGLANAQGGTLLVGVNQDGTISGCHPFHGTTTDPARLEATIRQFTSPALSSRVEVVSVDSREVVGITVEASRTPVATQWGLYHARRVNADDHPELVGMGPAYLFTRYRDANAIDWARTPLPGLRADDLDLAAFKAARELMARTSGALAALDDDDLLRTLGFRNDSPAPYTYGALLIFGKRKALERHLPHHRVIIADERGSASTTRTNAPLAHLARELYSRDSTVPAEVRELVVNALVHRDYALPGPVSVYLGPQRTTVSSPGGAPRGVQLHSPDLVSTTYAPRSPALSAAMAHLGVASATGQGIARVTKRQISGGFSRPSFAGSNEHGVTVTLWRVPLNPAMPGVVAASGRTLSLEELLVLDAWHMNPADALENRAAEMGLPLGAVRSIQRRLAAEGLGPATGPNSEAGASVQGQSAELRVISLVAAQGEVTSGEVAEHLGVSQQQGYRTLKKLVDSGRLRKVGTTRTTRYRLPAGEAG